MIGKRLSEFRGNVRKNMGLAIVGAFALVIGLSWNEAIQEIVKDILAHFDITGAAAQYKTIAAVLSTIICVAGIMYFSRWSEEQAK